MERLSRIFPAKRESILSPNESRMAAKSGVSTKPAPLFWDLFGRTGQHRSFPSPGCVLPHPLQNRVPRGERAPVALCRELTEPAGETSPSAPAKKERQAFACLSFFVSAHKNSATRHGCAPAQCVSWGERAPVALCREPTEAAAETSPMSIYACFPIRPHPLHLPPAPRTHPVSPFSGFSGCGWLFLPFFDPQNFWACFCSLCQYVSQIKAVRDTM